MESLYSPNVRFAFANLIRADQPQSCNAVFLATLLQCRELLHLVNIRGHHQLSAMAKRHIVFRAKFIGEAIALHAEPRLERILRIVNSGMIYTAVARAGGHAQLWKLLDEKNVLPTRGDGARNSASNHASADD